MTLNLKEARALRDTVRKTGKVFALTHNYTGYPMVKEARELVRSGKLGKDFENRRRISAGLAARQDRGRRPETGGVAQRSEKGGRELLPRRHRHARGKSRPLHHRAGDRIAVRGVHDIYSGPQTGGRREPAAALQRRREGRSALLANFLRRGKQSEHPRLWHEKVRSRGGRNIRTN